MGRSQDLYIEAKKIIPGGTQLLSKRPEMFLPDIWPAYYEKAKGYEVWDLDGKKYTDMSYMGIGSCILGYADDDVDSSVKKVIDCGSMSTLNPKEEVELARLLLDIHPWAQMARFQRTGGEAMSVSVRIARTYTKKDVVLFCGYHGWHDWYLSANLSDDRSLDGHLLPGLSPNGVPRHLKASSYPFKYNDVEGLNILLSEHKGSVGTIVLEAIRNEIPKKEFLDAITNAAKQYGIIIIVDEITSGWRLNLGGAHLLYGFEPDIAVFAKGMSNGYPMAAVIGKKNVMGSAQESFISSTYWTERIGPVAAIATINKLRDNNVSYKLISSGKAVKEIWSSAAHNAGLTVSVSGIDPLGHFEFKHEEPMVLKTLFTQSMLEKGFLATNAFYASYAHDNKAIANYSAAVSSAFGEIKKAIDSKEPKRFLNGPVCHSGFKRLA